ncbi:glucose-1-phosphate thymidylyltransferase RfbA [Prochlorococcus sp. MIT 1223]|uniref:glucose-1-phosphate thymidylyltransferase RfbA n=1 Tax=Prochlorococcus sp. MIT 1223 TaxID=3096217 RepID=UPI002A75F95C|nr:glucose-1-phosphate thymidylyltransferase RfbA [Prochlorococcus sp. MIT 1223]
MISKGIILAGGKGTRLRPLTNVLNKHLLPIYDKPMIYYPLCTLMLAGIKDILLITNPLDKVYFEKLLKNGEQWGISISYKLQVNPVGLVDSFLIGEKFLDGNSVALILGDNLFHGDGLIQKLLDMSKLRTGAKVLAYPVKDPERYGVVEFNSNGNVLSLSEKPKFPKSNYAITGLYFYDSTVVERSKQIKPSSRGELEITDLNNLYLDDNQLSVELMGRGMAWLDTGTFDSLYEASGYIRTLELRQGFKIACPEEVSWRNGWINDSQLVKLANSSISNDYSSYLMQLLEK